MAGPLVEVEGATELARVLRDIGDKGLQRAARNVYRRAAAVVAAEARSRVPVGKTRRLQRSIRVTAGLTGGGVAAGGKAAPYAAARHWGRIKGNVGRPPGNRQGISPVAGVPFLYDAAAARASEVYVIAATEFVDLFAAVEHLTK